MEGLWVNNIIKVDNPVYSTKQNLKETYKGYHVMITNIERTPPGVPDTWLGGVVRFYSDNHKDLNRFAQYNTLPEYDDTMVIYTGDKKSTSFYIGGIL